MELISHIRCFVRNELGKQCIVHYYSNQQQSDVMPCRFFADRGSTPNTCYLNTALHSSHIFSFPAFKCNLGKSNGSEHIQQISIPKDTKFKKNKKTDAWKQMASPQVTNIFQSVWEVGRWLDGGCPAQTQSTGLWQSSSVGEGAS